MNYRPGVASQSVGERVGLESSDIRGIKGEAVHPFW
jgi:hypothetical protein